MAVTINRAGSAKSKPAPVSSGKMLPPKQLEMLECATCAQTLPAWEFDDSAGFPPDSCECKSCALAREIVQIPRSDNTSNREGADAPMRVCAECGMTKPLATGFMRHGKGYKPVCRACMRPTDTETDAEIATLSPQLERLFQVIFDPKPDPVAHIPDDGLECMTCHRVLPEGAFSSQTGSIENPTGRAYSCMTCELELERQPKAKAAPYVGIPAASAWQTQRALRESANDALRWKEPVTIIRDDMPEGCLSYLRTFSGR